MAGDSPETTRGCKTHTAAMTSTAATFVDGVTIAHPRNSTMQYCYNGYLTSLMRIIKHKKGFLKGIMWDAQVMCSEIGAYRLDMDQNNEWFEYLLAFNDFRLCFWSWSIGEEFELSLTSNLLSEVWYALDRSAFRRHWTSCIMLVIYIQLYLYWLWFFHICLLVQHLL